MIKSFRSMQVLRGVAAMMILVGHAATAVPGMGIDRLARAYLDIFPAGVDIFFVLSGFIICHTLCLSRPRTMLDAIDFAARRVTRLYPIYWCVLLMSYCVSFFTPISPPGFPIAPAMSLISLSGTANYFIPQAWSLSFEAYFYLVVTGLILVSRVWLFQLMAVWLVLQAIAAILWTGVEVHTHALIMEFGLGCTLRAVIDRVRPGFPAASLALALAAAALSTGAVLASHDSLGSWPRVFTFGLGGAFLLMGMLLAELRGARFPQALVALGNASYSIYLSHGLVLIALISLSRQVGLIERLSRVQLPGLIIAWIVVALACGLVCHRFIEQPLLRATRRLLDLLAYRGKDAALRPA